MPATTSHAVRVRALLVLGRVSNLPTVWSNCLAGWWLGGAGNLPALLLVTFGATCLYIAGMYLNDVFDTEFDRKYRSERPIPAGVIDPATVVFHSLGWMVVGCLLLVPLGLTSAFLTIALLLSIIFYDAVHKEISWSPVVMSLCRFFLILLAASTGDEGVTGLAVWSALVLACYIVGLSYLAKQESAPGLLRYWPTVLLAVPLVLAIIVNEGRYRFLGVVLMLVLAVWVVRCIGKTYGQSTPQVGRTVSGLLAGIVLVDLLATGGGLVVWDLPADVGGDFWLSGTFVVFFLLARLFQRYIPAT